MKKIICIVLCFVMILSVFAIVPFGVGAKEVELTSTGVSQSEAVSWINQQGGASYDIDPSTEGTQCVEFVRAYVNYLVNGNPWADAWGGPTGNGYEIWNNPIWNRLGWTVYENTFDFMPQPGDIFSSGTTPYGHTGVVISSDIYSAVIADANSVAGADGQYHGSPVRIHNISWRLASSNTAYGATHYIRPNFTITNDSYSPHGFLDVAEAIGNKIHVKGWVYDADSPTTPVNVKICVGDEQHLFCANKDLDPAVIEATGSNNHCFEETFITNKNGTQIINAYGMNISSLGQETDDSSRNVALVQTGKQVYVNSSLGFSTIGDANRDGVVSILDTTTIQQYLANLLSSKNINIAASCVYDNRLSIIDATTIQQFLARLIVKFPNEVLVNPMVSYKGHIEGLGWQEEVFSTEQNIQTAGTTGESLRFEAFIINLTDKNETSMISYRSHVSNIGWQNWVSSGEISGTTGQRLPIEAIEIKLEEPYASKYDVIYRTHSAYVGWQKWTKNGGTSGSTGIGLRMEALQMFVVPKDTFEVDEENAYISKLNLSYQANSRNKGWLDTVSENQVAGTTGESRPLDGLIINLNDYGNNMGVIYKVHISDIGWRDWQNSGTVAGVIDGAHDIEAIQIKLTGIAEQIFDIYYRVHVANVGWMGWAQNGESAGTTSGAKAVEAIQIMLLNKGAIYNKEGNSFIDYSQVTTTVNSAFVDFINNPKWSNGTYWGGGQGPKLSSWGSSGCCAYAADFVKYCYNVNSPSSGVPYYDAGSVRTGDIIQFNPTHWVVVLSRNGNSLYTAEGNWESRVVVSDSKYSVVGNNIYVNGRYWRQFNIGYHYI